MSGVSRSEAIEREEIGYLGRAGIMQTRQRYHAEKKERARGFIRSPEERSIWV